MHRTFLASAVGGVVGLIAGSLVAGVVFAWMQGWHSVLGLPLLVLSGVPVYSPLAIWRWAQWWIWQEPTRFQFPGIAGLVTFGLVSWPVWRRGATADGGAAWATTTDLREAELYASHGIVLGKFSGRTLRYDGPAHGLVVAPTRSGKTSSTVIPTLLEWQESLLIHDPKNELYDLTAWQRTAFSKVIHLDPTSPTSDCFNPLDAIRLGTLHEMRDLRVLCDMLGDPDGEPTSGDSSAHFSELATDLHMGVAVHGLYTRQATTLRGLDDFYASEANLEILLKDMEATRHTRAGCHPAVRRAVRVVNRLADRELSGVISTASRALRLYLDPLVARMTSRSDLTLADLRERTRPTTVYLTVPYSDQERLRPFSRLVIRQILGYTTQHLQGWRHRLLMKIDEVQALNRMLAISEALNYAAGYGVYLWLITPSLHELDRLYGPNNNFLEGCHIRVAYAPNDFAIARRFSQQTGEQETEKIRQSWSQDVQSFLRRKTTSHETERVPLLSPTALMLLNKEQVLLLVGNMKPALLTKARYWRQWRWRLAQWRRRWGGTHAA